MACSHGDLKFVRLPVFAAEGRLVFLSRDYHERTVCSPTGRVAGRQGRGALVGSELQGQKKSESVSEAFGRKNQQS